MTNGLAHLDQVDMSDIGDNERLGEEIRKLRKVRGLSLSDLA